MSKELIEKLREASYSASHGEMADLLQEAADALEAKAAPVGEREAFEAEWPYRTDRCDGDYLSQRTADGWKGFQAGAAYQRAQQPQSAEAVAWAHYAKVGGNWFMQWPTYHREKDAIDALTEYGKGETVVVRPLYTTPQPSAGVVMPEVKPEIQQKDKRGDYPSQDCYNDGLVDGWNACLDEVARLNGKEVV